MIAVDTKILFDTHRAEMSFHACAFACWKSLTKGSAVWRIPVNCLREFLAIVTNLKLFRPPSRPDQAMTQVDAWLASPHARALHSGAKHWPILSKLVAKVCWQGGLFHDARIAPICSENGLSMVYTPDRDFGRFKDLKSINPLV